MYFLIVTCVSGYNWKAIILDEDVTLSSGYWRGRHSDIWFRRRESLPVSGGFSTPVIVGVTCVVFNAFYSWRLSAVTSVMISPRCCTKPQRDSRGWLGKGPPWQFGMVLDRRPFDELVSHTSCACRAHSPKITNVGRLQYSDDTFRFQLIIETLHFYCDVWSEIQFTKGHLHSFSSIPAKQRGCFKII